MYRRTIVRLKIENTGCDMNYRVHIRAMSKGKKKKEPDSRTGAGSSSVSCSQEWIQRGGEEDEVRAKVHTLPLGDSTSHPQGPFPFDLLLKVF